MTEPLTLDLLPEPQETAPAPRQRRGGQPKQERPPKPILHKKPKILPDPGQQRSEQYWDTNGARMFVAVCEKISRKVGWRPYESFRRTVEICDAALRAQSLNPGDAEAEYLRLIAGIDRGVLDLMAEFLGTLYLTAWPTGFDTTNPPDFRDHLGTAYMAITQSDKFLGQFFTPWPVAKMMADVLADPAEALARTPDHPLTVCDPAVGSGVLLLAYANALPWEAIQDGKVIFMGQDKDPCCAHMARLNLLCRGMTGRWPPLLLIDRALAGISREMAAAAEAAAPHGQVPPEQIAAESCQDYAAVGRAFGRLDGSTTDAALAPPAPRVKKIPRRQQPRAVRDGPVAGMVGTQGPAV